MAYNFIFHNNNSKCFRLIKSFSHLRDSEFRTTLSVHKMQQNRYRIPQDKKRELTFGKDSVKCYYLLPNELVDIESGSPRYSISRSTPTSGFGKPARLEDNTLNASPMPGSNVRDVKTSDGELILRFRGIFPEQSRAKFRQTRPTSDVRAVFLVLLYLSSFFFVFFFFFSLSLSFSLVPFLSRPFRLVWCSHVEVNRETGVSHTSRFFVCFRYFRVDAVKR